MFEGYIYRHWIINDKGIEKSYIGRVYNKTPEKRWGINGKKYLGKDKNGKEKEHKMARAIKKYGWESFNHEILLHFSCNTKEETNFWLNQWEKWYIEKYNSYYNGYNSTLGGEGVVGYNHSNETRVKIGEAGKGREVSKETREKLSNARKGTKRSDITKQKISNKKYGKKIAPFSLETRQRMSKSHTGKKLGPMKDSTRKKLSDNHSGDKNARAKKIICLEEPLLEFNTLLEAKAWCGRNPCAHLKGETKYAGKHPETGEKLHWMYYEDWLKLQENN